MADQTKSFNAASGFPVVTSLGGTALFTTGVSATPLSIPVSGPFALSGFARQQPATHG